MGRSRAVSKISDDDPSQRSSKRKRVASNAENTETGSYTGVLGQGSGERKAPLYHCNYCNKDISGMIRIKCVVCADFDLCVECFSVGAEIYPHKSNHHYRVMDNLAFPLICLDWNADEETLLLEGIGMYGFGNWAEVAEHVGTKRKAQCIHHYNLIYINSPCFPLPDLSHVIGKSKDDLLAMAKVSGDMKIETVVIGELPVPPKEEPVKCDDARKSADPQSLAHQISETVDGSFTGSAKTSNNTFQVKNETKVEEAQADRSIGGKKLRMPGDEGPVTELSGYNFKRKEFEIEYDNDAEQLLAEMEFKETDNEHERELKIRVLRIYSKRLDERKRRKDFILERSLLYADPFEKNLSPEEKEIYMRFKVFARFHPSEDHEALVHRIIKEHHIMRRIDDLKEARASGCRTAAEANKFTKQKWKKENEESVLRIKECSQVGAFPKPEVSPRGLIRVSTDPFSAGIDQNSAMQPIMSALDVWDVTGLTGVDLLSETEKQLCSEIRILPVHYLKMVQIMSVQVLSGNVSKRSDAYNLFKVEPFKIDKVYDMLVKKGIAQS